MDSLSISPISTLPHELLHEILLHVDSDFYKSHANISCVCKLWNGIVESNLFWKRLSLIKQLKDPTFFKQSLKEDSINWKEVYKTALIANSKIKKKRNSEDAQLILDNVEFPTYIAFKPSNRCIIS